jgi:hypothetical protein
MRVTCEEPGFETAYLEIETARWTRPEVDALVSGALTEKWFAVLQRKVTGVCLPTLEGEPVTIPGHLTPEALDRLDYVLWNWLVAAVTAVGRELISLGNAPWRRLSPTPEKATATKPSQTP